MFTGHVSNLLSTVDSTSSLVSGLFGCLLDVSDLLSTVDSTRCDIIKNAVIVTLL